MAKSVSKLVADREAIARTVTSSADKHGAEIVPDLTNALWPDGVPQTLAPKDLVAALANHLKKATSALVEADLALAAEVADDPVARADRDEAAGELRSTFIDYRGLIRATYGPDLLPRYGLDGDTPGPVDTLANAATNVARLLRDNPFTAATPKRGRAALNNIELADGMDEAVTALKDRLDDVKAEEREYHTALVVRNEGMDTWSASYQGVAGALSALYHLAGADELATRVRPTTRRRAGLPESEDEASGGGEKAGEVESADGNASSDS